MNRERAYSRVPRPARLLPAAVMLMTLLTISHPAPGQTPSPSPASDPRRDDRVLDITPATRQAIGRALDYLRAEQAAEGSWRGPRGRNTGVASFAVLSFVATGVVPNRGADGRVVARGIDYVLAHAQLNGLISNPQDTAHGPMYEHAMSTLLLAEIWGMYQRPGVLDALQRATQLIISSQNDQGGWRYQPRPADADVSVTVMQLVALRAAKNAGLRVPRQTFDNGVAYVKSCALPSGGFLYQPGDAGGPLYSRTAAGVCSLLTSGDYESPEVTGGLRYLQDRKDPEVRGSAHLMYALYYAAQATYQARDASEWPTWFGATRDELLSLQEPDGHWDGEAGPIYGTAMAVLTLTVPYRYLPIYQH